MNSVVDQSSDYLGLVRTIVFSATGRRSYETEILRQRERAEASEQQALVTAQMLQQMLIPPPPPAIEGLDLGAAFRLPETGP